MRINQTGNVALCQVVKTVDWLVHNTKIAVFDPIEFSGYQRKIDHKHVDKIVHFITRDFFMPSSIICALDDIYSEDAVLRVVDGQHRVEAFKKLKKANSEEYNKIMDKQISVVVIEKSNIYLEIDTFITINKTSKKVDTSLAYVLKSKLNKSRSSSDLNFSRREYLGVEVAYEINFRRENSLWFNTISFEGNPKENQQLISLNAFVKSLRSLFFALEKTGLFELSWKTQSEIDSLIHDASNIVDYIWECVSKKWKDQFLMDLSKRSIIQGAIGFNAINKSIISVLLEEGDKIKDKKDLMIFLDSLISSFDIDSINWEQKGTFAKYSSEAGYIIVAAELLNNSTFKNIR